jgi:hypothetical protein
MGLRSGKKNEVLLNEKKRNQKAGLNMLDKLMKTVNTQCGLEFIPG